MTFRKHTRVKCFRLDTIHLLLLLQGRIRTENIPEGSTYLRCQYDFITDGLMFVIEHPDFDEVDQAAHPPMIELEFDVIDEKGIKVWWKADGEADKKPFCDCDSILFTKFEEGRWWCNACGALIRCAFKFSADDTEPHAASIKDVASGLFVCSNHEGAAQQYTKIRQAENKDR
jgi:hypothetical protein